MRIKIDSMPFEYGHKILFYHDQDGKRYVAEPVELVFKEVTPGSLISPTMFIPDNDCDELFADMAQYLDDHNIKTDTQRNEESRQRGTLESMHNHIMDLKAVINDLFDLVLKRKHKQPVYNIATPTLNVKEYCERPQAEPTIWTNTVGGYHA